jgi:hypothetical protein
MTALVLAHQIAPQGSVEEQEAEDAIDALDRHQIKQLVLLLSEDKMLQIRITRDADVAVSERGYSLSPVALAFIQQVASGAVQAQVLIGRENEFVPAQSRFRHYN